MATAPWPRLQLIDAFESQQTRLLRPSGCSGSGSSSCSFSAWPSHIWLSTSRNWSQLQKFDFSGHRFVAVSTRGLLPVAQLALITDLAWGNDWTWVIAVWFAYLQSCRILQHRLPCELYCRRSEQGFPPSTSFPQMTWQPCLRRMLRVLYCL